MFCRHETKANCSFLAVIFLVFYILQKKELFKEDATMNNFRIHHRIIIVMLYYTSTCSLFPLANVAKSTTGYVSGPGSSKFTPCFLNIDEIFFSKVELGQTIVDS